MRNRFERTVVSSIVMSDLSILRNCELRLNYFQRIFGVVESHVTRYNFVVVENVFWEVTFQIHRSFRHASAGIDGEILFLLIVFKKLNRLLMNHKSLLILDLSLVVINDSPCDRVSHFYFWFIRILPRFLLPVA